jgi:hypothetical protein
VQNAIHPLSFVLAVLVGSPNGGIDVSRVAVGVMGLSVHGPSPRQLTWGTEIKLGLGDRVTFEITEVEQPSPPDEILSTAV